MDVFQGRAFFFSLASIFGSTLDLITPGVGFRVRVRVRIRVRVRVRVRVSVRVRVRVRDLITPRFDLWLGG